jgi:hypothetical protein
MACRQAGITDAGYSFIRAIRGIRGFPFVSIRVNSWLRSDFFAPVAEIWEYG